MCFMQLGKKAILVLDNSIRVVVLLGCHIEFRWISRNWMGNNWMIILSCMIDLDACEGEEMEVKDTVFKLCSWT